MAGQEGRHVVSERACGAGQQGVRGGDTARWSPSTGLKHGRGCAHASGSGHKTLQWRGTGGAGVAHLCRAHCTALSRPRAAWRQFTCTPSREGATHGGGYSTVCLLAALDVDSELALLTRMLTTRSHATGGGRLYARTTILTRRKLHLVALRRRAVVPPWRTRRTAARRVVACRPCLACGCVRGCACCCRPINRAHVTRQPASRRSVLPVSCLLAAWCQGQGDEGAPG